MDFKKFLQELIDAENKIVTANEIVSRQSEKNKVLLSDEKNIKDSIVLLNNSKQSILSEIEKIRAEKVSIIDDLSGKIDILSTNFSEKKKELDSCTNGINEINSKLPELITIVSSHEERLLKAKRELDSVLSELADVKALNKQLFDEAQSEEAHIVELKNTISSLEKTRDSIREEIKVRESEKEKQLTAKIKSYDAQMDAADKKYKEIETAAKAVHEAESEANKKLQEAEKKLYEVSKEIPQIEAQRKSIEAQRENLDMREKEIKYAWLRIKKEIKDKKLETDLSDLEELLCEK